MKSWEMKRRTFLKGLGISIALPVLDVMVPSIASAADKGAPRFAAIYIPTGLYGQGWDPSKSGTAKNGTFGNDRYFAADTTSEWGLTAWRPKKQGALVDPLPPILGGLENMKQHLTVVSGLSTRPKEHGAPIVWLTDSPYGDDDPANFQTSMDQEIANRYNYVPGSTIVFCPYDYGYPQFSFISYNRKIGGDFRVPKSTNARTKFNQLFGSCDPKVMAQLTSQQVNNKSVLDYVADSLSSVQKKLGKDDKVRLDAYLTNVRELEKQMTAVPLNQCPTAPISDPLNATGAYALVSQNNMMVDIMALALASDAMPIATLMLDTDGNGSNEYAARVAYNNSPFVGVNGNAVQFASPTTEWHFDVSHHGNEFDRVEQCIAMNRYEVMYFKRLIEKMNGMPAEPNGLTPLDNSIVMTGAGMSDSNAHVNTNLPIVLAGGKKFGINKGQHLAYPMNTPLGNMYYTLLKAMGVPGVTDFNTYSTLLSGLYT